MSSSFTRRCNTTVSGGVSAVYDPKSICWEVLYQDPKTGELVYYLHPAAWRQSVKQELESLGVRFENAIVRALKS